VPFSIVFHILVMYQLTLCCYALSYHS
jgi:hypothetical protein